MSRSDICSLAYDGKFRELKEKIDLRPSLATTIDENERMPLHWVASGGHSDIARFLLDLRVPVDNKDDSQWTPLMIAVSAGRDVIVSMLIACGADVNSTNEGGQTPLHYAASKNRYEIAEVLLQNGAYVNAQDQTCGSSPLHRAASRGHSKMVKLLLKHGACCDIQDVEGNTALHLACQEERAGIAVVLVENGANLHVLNKEKLAPLELANKGLARQLVQINIAL